MRTKRYNRRVESDRRFGALHFGRISRRAVLITYESGATRQRTYSDLSILYIASEQTIDVTVHKTSWMISGVNFSHGGGSKRWPLALQDHPQVGETMCLLSR